MVPTDGCAPFCGFPRFTPLLASLAVPQIPSKVIHVPTGPDTTEVNSTGTEMVRDATEERRRFGGVKGGGGSVETAEARHCVGCGIRANGTTSRQERSNASASICPAGESPRRTNPSLRRATVGG